MTSAEQSAILLELAVQLKKNGSWAGETHVQKAAFLLQELLGVPSEFEFVLYRHGPFSFDLRDRLEQMEAGRHIRLVEQPYPYGPKIVEGKAATRLRQQAGVQDLFSEQVEFVAQELGNSSVSALERVATALFVELEGCQTPESRVDRLVRLKPHVKASEAEAAFVRLHEIRDKAIRSGLAREGVARACCADPAA